MSLELTPHHMIEIRRGRRRRGKYTLTALPRIYDSEARPWTAIHRRRLPEEHFTCQALYQEPPPIRGNNGSSDVAVLHEIQICLGHILRTWYLSRRQFGCLNSRVHGQQ